MDGPLYPQAGLLKFPAGVSTNSAKPRNYGRRRLNKNPAGLRLKFG